MLKLSPNRTLLSSTFFKNIKRRCNVASIRHFHPYARSVTSIHTSSLSHPHGMGVGSLPSTSLHSTANTNAIPHLYPHRNNKKHQQTRNLSSHEYEYPLRTEVPTITRSLAPDYNNEDESPYSSPSTTDTKEGTRKYPPNGLQDYFDDTNEFSTNQRQQILNQQREKSPILTSQPIGSTPPNFLPSVTKKEKNHFNKVSPQTEITTLPNGLRVASQETFGQVCTFGLIASCGSRMEQDQRTMGCNHLLELLAFGGTTRNTESDISTRLDSMGGVSFCNSSREQFLFCIDVLRPNVPQAMTLLFDVFLHPRITEEDVEQVKKMVEWQWLDMLPEIRLGEGLQTAAYQPLDGGERRQQLGRPHFCPLEALPHLNATVLKDFRNQHLLDPKELVLAGAGIQHDELVQLAHQHFGHLQSVHEEGKNKIIPSIYTGGDVRQTTTTTDGLTRVALAFPTGGWHQTHDVLAACILQTLLGGGNSFSAGGPGKGMYSRLYRHVLNRHFWAESCEAFTSFHDETGLIGISGSSTPDRAGDVVRVLTDHFLMLETELVSDEEFDRARNMLKCNVLTQLESRLVLFEDVGRQILTYGKREGTEEMCAKIDGVTKEDLRSLVRKALRNDSVDEKNRNNTPTLSVVFHNPSDHDQVDSIPSHLEVARWFAS